MIEKIIKENNAVIMNYANDSLFIKKPEYFQDPAHLNDDGAILFSQMVQVKLKQTSLMMIH
jgi:lysophospholipase L1-like esterase